MEKNKLLKVASILLIVFGVVLALLAIIFFAAGDLVAEVIGKSGEEFEGMDAETAAAAVKLGVLVLGIVLLVEAVAYIAAGVIGVQQKSAQLCFIVGIVLVVLCGIGAITNIVEGQILSAVIGLIVPVLYLVGAIQLKKAAADEVITATSEENI